MATIGAMVVALVFDDHPILGKAQIGSRDECAEAVVQILIHVQTRQPGADECHAQNRLLRGLGAVVDEVCRFTSGPGSGPTGERFRGCANLLHRSEGCSAIDDGVTQRHEFGHGQPGCQMRPGSASADHRYAVASDDVAVVECELVALDPFDPRRPPGWRDGDMDAQPDVKPRWERKTEQRCSRGVTEGGASGKSALESAHECERR